MDLEKLSALIDQSLVETVTQSHPVSATLDPIVVCKEKMFNRFSSFQNFFKNTMRELVEDFTEHFLEKNPAAALKLKNILGPQERRHLHQSNPQFHFEVQKRKHAFYVPFCSMFSMLYLFIHP